MTRSPHYRLVGQKNLLTPRLHITIGALLVGIQSIISICPGQFRKFSYQLTTSGSHLGINFDSMQSINWFQLFMVMWLNIQVASSEFICNDNGTPARVAAKVGFCARPIIPAERVNQRLDPSATFWVYQASPGRGRSFTCDGVSIASHPTTSRFCCKLNKLPYAQGVTNAFLRDSCYTRDRKR
ncbi:hypothetical protein MJO28_016263 [Puccinia striiformis f. sp. tritici]|uniref:Uncharacterized protein n=3 Tax=Puccinia striiformis TaxID=27350 RepID=A0A2S4VFG7_9BASI|nr:hypothetical protein Pst134EA_030605 [Puccinia striiformis f. sp. tritici]KAH9440530.1 hypothetical protein Pst134EB_031139 [Puccinia striiformis f. sp. tritici]KAH9446698.1 hypothetical protein Pst134EA_030605 [Puccinia striiformis f. sp. tritici]KAI7935392.1 hypothetical protein MJO28_016263 [Puccinia striiformis f. sp. tritici]POW08263.1 hypothetical protein PSTT_07674 [Puccinia striiformis]